MWLPKSRGGRVPRKLKKRVRRQFGTAFNWMWRQEQAWIRAEARFQFAWFPGGIQVTTF